METMEIKVEKALKIMKYQDWNWMFAEYSKPAYSRAYSSMRAFVKLVATIEDSNIAKALRDLWTATYQLVHATMFKSNPEAVAEFETKEAELMAVIKPTYAIAA